MGFILPPHEDYLTRAKEKRQQQATKIPAEWVLKAIPTVLDAPSALEYVRSSAVLTQDEITITENTNVNHLLEKLASRQLTSVQVVTAFCKRAAVVHQLTTCCTEIFFEDAIAEANRLDHYLESTGKTVGPLHGLPISVKDIVDIKGQDTSLGWVGLANKPATRDSGTTTMLTRLGAVLYVKTNIPQSLMMSDSLNHVFGQCVHPMNRQFISGGSSGGESALIGARGSILGVGTDIGGSIRIPASLCGIYGLCPTYARHPYERAGIKQRIIMSTAGPMATHLASIEKYMESLPEAMPWELDNLVTPMPWRKELCNILPDGRKLKIGYILDDHVVKPQPPVTRAVQLVVEALKKAGHEVFQWNSTSHKLAYDLWLKAILSDGGAGCKRLCDMSGEPLIEGMLVGQESDLLTTEQTHQLMHDIDAYKAQYLWRWVELGMDAIVMPVTPWVGYEPGTWVKSKQYVGYTSLANLLDWPALSIPVTTASKTKDGNPASDWMDHTPRNAADEFNTSQYDIDLVDGLPVGVQIIAGKYGDEKCIAIGKVIDTLLKTMTAS